MRHLLRENIMLRQIRDGSTRAPRSAFRKTALATTAVAVSVLTGCTTFKPYYVPNAAELNNANDPLAVSFCQDARQTAYRLLHTYAERANQHDQIQKWGALGLLPLAGVVAYKSIVAPNLGDIVGLSAAGGVGFAGLRFLSTNQQERIYVAGMEALTCALAVVEPTMVPAYLRADHSLAKAQLAAFRNFIAEFKPASEPPGMFIRSGADQKPQMLAESDRKKLVEIANVIDRGIQETMQRLLSQYPGADSAERRLCQATLRIAGSVNRQLAEASPDLASISGKLTAFTSFPNINVPASETPGAPARKAADKGDEDMRTARAGVAESQAMKMANEMEVKLADAVRKLADDADSVPDPAPASPTPSVADTCKVEMVAPPPSLTVVHSGDTEGTVTLKAGQVFEVLVRASGQMPHIDVVPSKTGGNFTVSEVELKDGAFVRTVTVVEMPDPKFPNSMSVSVASENNQTVTTIKLEIEPPPK